MTSRRLLLVHAHPDDETITTGATMARYADEGAVVTLVTCTLGELGEVMVPELAGLTSDRADQLGGYRIGELRGAMRRLGVTDHRFLGRAGRWRDSGMMGSPGNDDPRAFWQCATDVGAFSNALHQLVAVIRETRPQVMITYDRNGGYGHPDHIMAHRVAMEAAHRASTLDDHSEPWTIEKIYWTAMPRSEIQRGIDEFETYRGSSFTNVASVDELPFGNPDDEVTTAVDASKWIEDKRDALRAHATQLAVDGPFFALSNLIAQPLLGVEYFRLAKGDPAGERDGAGRETDLFAGVTT